MLDNLFEQWLQRGDLLPLGKEGKHLLVETSYFILPTACTTSFFVSSQKAMFLYWHILEQEHYEQLKRLNVAYQFNLPSLVGVYGADAKRKAKWLLENMYYQFKGTDTHSLSSWEAIVHKNKFRKT